MKLQTKDQGALIFSTKFNMNFIYNVQKIAILVISLNTIKNLKKCTQTGYTFKIRGTLLVIMYSEA